MTIDTISDMLTRIRNANLVRKSTVLINNTKINRKICEILYKEGFISGFSVLESNKKELIINLKYKTTTPVSNRFLGEPCLTNLKRISKPSLRVYSNFKEIPKILGGFGIIIISTSKGLMTDKEARLCRLGGELLCAVW
uniref:ribosomal protein S8 n=1 Tax=Prototheca miyajii TaxID=2034260 RepID=UPI0030011245